MGVALLCCTYGGNSDCQAIVAQCLEPLKRYLTEYACKGNMSTHDLTVLFGKLMDSMDGKGSMPQLVQKMLMRIVRCKDVPISLATMYVSKAAPFVRSTRKFESFGLSNFKMIDPDQAKGKKKKAGGASGASTSRLERFLLEKVSLPACTRVPPHPLSFCLGPHARLGRPWGSSPHVRALVLVLAHGATAVQLNPPCSLLTEPLLRVAHAPTGENEAQLDAHALRACCGLPAALLLSAAACATAYGGADIPHLPPDRGALAQVPPLAPAGVGLPRAAQLVPVE